MAFIEMTCKCDASFQVELEDNDTLALLWAQSFVESHRVCGFMEPVKNNDNEKYRGTDIMWVERKEKEL
jgi:hypothetical protein